MHSVSTPTIGALRLRTFFLVGLVRTFTASSSLSITGHKRYFRKIAGDLDAIEYKIAVAESSLCCLHSVVDTLPISISLLMPECFYLFFLIFVSHVTRQYLSSVTIFPAVSHCLQCVMQGQISSRNLFSERSVFTSIRFYKLSEFLLHYIEHFRIHYQQVVAPLSTSMHQLVDPIDSHDKCTVPLLLL